jgi:hypothetical protein
MKYAFLHTEGPLADRLMATLQAAKIIGADTRCASRGTSSQSGFVKVVRIGDGNSSYLQIIVPDTPSGKDPIDSLQTMFDNWKVTLFNVVDPFLSETIVEPDTLPANRTSQGVITIYPKNNSDTLLSSGLEILLSNTGAGSLSSVSDLGDGTYQATITTPIAIGTDTISAVVISGTDTVDIFLDAVVSYVNPTSISENIISPDEFFLYQNSPNPFNPTTIIKYQIPKDGFVTLKIFDIVGNEVATLVNQEEAAGTHEIKFDTSQLSNRISSRDGYASGVYFYKIRAGEFSDTKKMLLLK